MTAALSAVCWVVYSVGSKERKLADNSVGLWAELWALPMVVRTEHDAAAERDGYWGSPRAAYWVGEAAAERVCW